ncbi:6825_t:CDS:10 [Diversispora eburnea]|uniref:6825_t:CDS:1 n=1 Tax=Diversispora eburnea TaxID=1213867 RepID=A0A9N8ZJM4_9GLOM|nr:6825_t:CDS:10 [Diversispora eburnea]
MVSTPSAYFARCTIEKTASELGTNIETGLSTQEANSKRKGSGYNEFEIEDGENPLIKFIKQFIENPLILLLLCSAVISLILGNPKDAFSVFLAVLIVTTVGFVQEYRSEKSLEALNKLVPHYCHLIRDGHLIEASATELVPGDLVKFRIGDRIPADAVNLEIDESNLTGEPKPRSKNTEVILDNNNTYQEITIQDRKNISFMGTLVKNGFGSGIVVGTGKNTEYGVVFSLVKEAETPKTPFQISMNDLGKKLSYLSGAIIAIIVLIGIIQGRNLLEMLTIGVSLAVAAIPEGLPIVVVVTLGLGVLRMAKKNVIIKKLNSVETLGSVNVICADKTGGLCNDAIIDENGKKFGQATDVALLDKYERISEIPFNSDQKWMSVVCKRISEKNEPETIFFKGSLEAVLGRCTSYYVSDSHKPPLDTSAKESVIRNVTAMSSLGLRCLGMAYGTDLTKLTFVGCVAMYDPPRKGVEQTIKKLIGGGVKVVMITGDSEQTALSISRKLGIPVNPSSRSSCLTGSDIESMTTSQLKAIISSVSVFARTAPKHKMAIVQAFQENGSIVAMSGDGADIGISMGKSGTDVSREAADIILVNDDFNAILDAVKEAALTLITMSTIAGLPNPLNAMQILWINILMDGPPAQSLGVEPVDESVMRQPPRKKNSPILTPALIMRVLTCASIIVAGTLFTYITEMSDGVVTARDTTMKKSIFELGIFSNSMFNLAVSFSLIGQLFVIYVPFFQSIFQTESLKFTDIVGLLLLTSTVFWIDEFRKHYHNQKQDDESEIINIMMEEV